MTPEKLATIPDWSDADLLKLYRHAFAMGWGGQTRTIDGRTVTFPSPQTMMDTIERLERRIDNAATDGGGMGTALARFN